MQVTVALIPPFRHQKGQCSNPYCVAEPYCAFEQPEPFSPRMNHIV